MSPTEQTASIIMTAECYLEFCVAHHIQSYRLVTIATARPRAGKTYILEKIGFWGFLVSIYEDRTQSYSRQVHEEDLMHRSRILPVTSFLQPVQSRQR